MKLKAGKRIHIQSYKHDGHLHRIWLESYFIDETNDCIILGNNRTKVIERNGRVWFTKEPAICYFFKREWFNVIAMLKKDGIHYYCNMSSPFIIDFEGLKYIDYDLDYKVFPNGKIIKLDKKEYDENKVLMNYPQEIQRIIEDSYERLEKRITDKSSPFIERDIEEKYKMFKEIIEQKKKEYKEPKK